MRAPHVLLTGATGSVGAEVLARLVAAGTRVSALIHRNGRFLASDGSVVESPEADSLSGNVRLDGFGLSTNERLELGRSVTCIVHCAATTDFGASQDEYDELNVGGTRHAIGLAREWDVPLVHISTAYVCGLRNDVIGEDELDAGQEFGNGYEQSKFRCEQLIRDASSHGLRAAVVRPAIVVGRSTDGAIREYKNMYPVVKLIVEGKLRSLPGRYDATLSLVPVDYVADVIAAVVFDIKSAVGGTYHAVGAADLSLRDVSDVFAEYPSFAVAKFVPAASFSIDDLERNEREYYLRIGARYTSYFGRRVGFDATNTEKLLGRRAPATGKDYLRLLLDFCLDSGYLGTPLPSIDDVLRRLGTE
ncbi:SDR family oxidoreductase [Antrihabitans sp. YC2-6]|uniref:SDR family oxidoreductase n=1 Tax=Antrihabitans sp. YC2-6 TaxID=2799498 RepID=UPI0018F42867|nr:SDR family oxidoreductase [Antrihabitans sp. YC2-6]MBJ8345386.1 SDR family oxidoreductase [Antrihabitans sp. YC2-6]